MEIDLDEDLRDGLAERAEAKGFSSAEAYAETILTIVLEELEADGADDSERSDVVEDRLEDLGYL